jgi:hypothetical protein
MALVFEFAIDLLGDLFDVSIRSDRVNGLCSLAKIQNYQEQSDNHPKKMAEESLHPEICS